MRVALVLLAAACATTGQGGGSPCWESAPEAAFVLPAASPDGGGPANITRLLMNAHAQECADSEPVTTATWHQKCEMQLQHLMGEHCGPAVSAWCSTSCAEGCGAAANRAVVEDTCARGARAGFMAAMRYCTGLVLRGHTFVPPAEGAPTCP